VKKLYNSDGIIKALLRMGLAINAILKQAGITLEELERYV